MSNEAKQPSLFDSQNCGSGRPVADRAGYPKRWPLSKAALTSEQLRRRLSEHMEKTPAGSSLDDCAVPPIMQEAAMQSLEGRAVDASLKGLLEQVVPRLGLDPQHVKKEARAGYVPPPDASAAAPEDSRFPWAHVALEKSRRQWPPNPRQGTGYSDTQMREDIVHGTKGLPIRDTSAKAAWELKNDALEQGIPAALFEGRNCWSPENSYLSLCRNVERPLHPEKKSPKAINPTPDDVQAYIEEQVFEPMKAELRLWDWLYRHAGDLAAAERPSDAYNLMTRTKRLKAPVTSRAALAAKLLYHCHDVTLGKTVFGSARKKPPYGDAADYTKDVPRFREVWHGRTDLSFKEAWRRRTEYETAIRQAEQARSRKAVKDFEKDIKETLFPFFSWHVGNGWSTSSLQSLSRKWTEYFKEKCISPRLHRSMINSDIVIEGEGIRRRYVSPAENAADPDTETRLLVHYIGHARRLLLIREVEDRGDLHDLLRDARKESRNDLARTKAAADLYDAVGQLIVDQATARRQTI